MTKFSILIVTKNRVKDLDVTLKNLEKTTSRKDVEVLVLSDGCPESKNYLKANHPLLKSFHLKKSIGASPARNALYKKAQGDYLIGLDDDSNFITDDYLIRIENIFENEKIGIIAFKEIKSLKLDKNIKLGLQSYYTNEFIGCGFCIKKKVYDQTRGFPRWMDIYGEEACVAIEALSIGYKIFYTDAIAVHHRVNKAKRKSNNHKIYRFKKSLLNGNKYFFVYFPGAMLPKPLIKIFIHNFRKYALINLKYFFAFLSVYLKLIIQMGYLLKNRSPVSKSTIIIKKQTKPLKF